jgi:hypothetical protein
MTRHNAALLSVVSGIAATVSCNPASPTPSAFCPAQGSLSATIDGVAWTAPCVDARYEVAFNRLTVTGSSRDYTETLTFTVVATGADNYSLGGPTPPTTAPPFSSARLSVGCEARPGVCPSWIVSPCCGQQDGNGSGNVALTTITSTRAAGSFSFTFAPNRLTGASGSKPVTNGQFNVTF